MAQRQAQNKTRATRRTGLVRPGDGGVARPRPRVCCAIFKQGVNTTSKPGRRWASGGGQCQAVPRLPHSRRASSQHLGGCAHGSRKPHGSGVDGPHALKRHSNVGVMCGMLKMVLARVRFLAAGIRRVCKVVTCAGRAGSMQVQILMYADDIAFEFCGWPQKKLP